MTPREEATSLARQWLAAHPLFVDTETTGLGPDAEICEIALLDQDGTALLETLIKPTIPIPRDAIRIHGITNAAVCREPAFDEAWPIITKLLATRTVIMYNSDFDLRLIRQSLGARRGAGNRALGAIEAQCAMLLYARYRGEWDDHHRSYRCQKLGDAARQCRLPMPQALHRAKADAELTRCLIRHMASQGSSALARPSHHRRPAPPIP